MRYLAIVAVSIDSIEWVWWNGVWTIHTVHSTYCIPLCYWCLYAVCAAQKSEVSKSLDELCTGMIEVK